MAAEGDPVAEKSTNWIVDSLPVSLPPKHKMMTGREECKMLETVLPAFQAQVLLWTSDSSSNPEQA